MERLGRSSRKEEVTRVRKLMLIKRIPTAFILVALWAGLRLAGVDLAPGSALGVLFTLFCFLVFVLEFVKSGDITLGVFGLDQAWSVLTLIVATATLTLLVRDARALSFMDLLIAIVAVCDGWVSPFNSFRTALRNWSGASVATETVHVDDTNN